MSFKHLFAPPWAHELRHKLAVFLSHFLPPLGPPLIYGIYRVYREVQKTGTVSEATLQTAASKSQEGEVAQLREEVEAAKSKESYVRKTLIESQAKWTNFCRGILGLCKSLLDFVRNPQSVPAQQTMVREIAEKVYKYEQILVVNEADLQDIEMRYKSVFAEGEGPTKKPPPLQHIEEQDESHAYLPQESQILSVDQAFPIAAVQYSKLKDFLLSSKDQMRVCAILQALRWRITRAHHGAVRKSVMMAYVEQDILSCATSDNTLLAQLINHESRKYVRSRLMQ